MLHSATMCRQKSGKPRLVAEIPRVQLYLVKVYRTKVCSNSIYWVRLDNIVLNVSKTDHDSGFLSWFRGGQERQFHCSCPTSVELAGCGSGSVTREAMCRLRPPCFCILSVCAPDVRRRSELSVEVAVCSSPDDILSPELPALWRPGLAAPRCAGLAAA